MNHSLDLMLVAVMVLISVLFAGYSLGPMKAKKWVLSKVSRYLGIKIMTWMLPKNCGCEDCPSVSKPSQLKHSAHRSS